MLQSGQGQRLRLCASHHDVNIFGAMGKDEDCPGPAVTGAGTEVNDLVVMRWLGNGPRHLVLTIYYLVVWQPAIEEWETNCSVCVADGLP